MASEYLESAVDLADKGIDPLDSSHNDIFSIEPVQLQFSLVSLLSLKISNNILILALKSNLIYRIDLNNPEFIDKIELFGSSGSNSAGSGPGGGSVSNRVKNLFLDPSGSHLIISTVKNVNYYLNKASKTPILLSRFKSLNISYIHWHEDQLPSSETSVRNFLIGTSTGQIYESSIEFKLSNNKITNSFLKLVWKNPINNSNSTAIDGIFVKYIETVKTLVSVVAQSDDIFYYKTENYNLQYHKGHAIFNTIFSNYSDYEKLDDIGLISGNKFVNNYKDFAWLTKSGIVFTSLDEFHLTDGKLLTHLNYLLNIQIPEARHPTNSQSVLLTTYHLLFLRDNELIVINRINQKVVYHKFLPTFLDNEKFLGLSADYQVNTFWIYSNYNIYELVVNNESKDIWKIYLKNNQFDNALKLVNDNTTGNKQANQFVTDLILSKKADYLLYEKQEYQQAAKNYAYTSRPFESVALTLLNFNQFDSLLQYLSIKLKLLAENKHTRTEKDEFYIQKTLLSSWIVELYMERLNKLENTLSINEDSNTSSNSNNNKSASNPELLHNQFEKFLNNNVGVLHKDTVYQILQNHNSRKYLLYFANLISDYDFILSYWVNLENWDESLKILEKKNDAALIYKYSNVLLINAPAKTLKLWMKLHQSLDYKKFIPAILTYNKSFNVANSKNIKSVPIDQNLVLNYLDFLIFHLNVTDTIIHNTYLSILTLYSHGKDRPENLILKYLEKYNEDINFDPDFILRLFLKFEKFKPAIHIYSILSEFENAIDLCLMHNYFDLACLIADRSFENDELRKKLWLKISEKMINQLIVQKVISGNKELMVDEDGKEIQIKSKIEDIVNNDKKFKEFLQQTETDKLAVNLVNSDDDDIKNLLTYLLSKCELLSIKDLLPLFPNFSSVNNFKLEIIKSLEAYGLKINQLNNSIKNSITFNGNLIENLKKLKISRYYLIEVENGQGLTIQNNSSCQICHNSIFLRKFLVFPCQHTFHIDCLVNGILNSSNKRNYKLKKNLIYQLQKNNVNVKSNDINETSNHLKINNSLKISKELEDILVAKCVLCSDMNVESIDEPFININSNTDKQLIKEWEL